ncbi:DUF2892 domain-containing protein [Ornithinimicrobium sp. F0845]|uniref:YgaP family membrane protein n=1 Tax=Ornithinimicrobium sp. F0845 TaxID=2926412 RepID=UPI001FF1E131|nr:DUF2892 domain-containing protein [Ornithinimicrobium sp. F0845]MCK0112453.1 DUF2892 domain-containing protein [Ornithinimicrobium sp. F0845]
MSHSEQGPPPDAWIPVILLFARDRSEAGWVWTRPEDVRRELAERHILAGVVGEGPRAMEDLVMARVAVHPDGLVAMLPEPDGPPVAGPRVEEVVSELAHAMRTVIVVDGELAVGTAGVPLEQVPPELTRTTEDRRTVYAWPGTERYVANAAALQLKEPVTWHDAEGWTVLASEHAPERVLTGLPPGATRSPFVVLSRRGPERTFEYVVGKGADDLRLMAWWGPWLEPVQDLGSAHEETRELLDRLVHPRFGDDQVPAHDGMTAEQRREVGQAMADPDGGAFLARIGAAFDLPEVAAQLAEQPREDDDPALTGEPVEVSGRLNLARAAYSEMQTAELTPQQERMARGVAWVELVIGLVALAVAIWGFLPGPWWLWLVAGVALTGDALKDLVVDPLRERRKAAEAARSADAG